MNKPPLRVALVGWLYIIAGAIGFVYHFPDIVAGDSGLYGALGTEAIRFAAIVCGVFLLRGSGRAKWFAIAWMGFHVVLSAFHDLSGLLVHLLFFVVIVWLLLRPGAGNFASQRTDRSRISVRPRV